MLKWCLNRSHQAKTAAELQSLASVGTRRDEGYKALRPNEIKKEEKLITKVMDVFQNEYLNPFSPLLETNELVNLSLGVPVGDVADDIINIWSSGKEKSELFVQERLVTKTKLFHDPLPRNKIPTFLSNPITIKKDNKIKIVEANRNILGKLLSLSTKHERPIDLEAVMAYPLYPVPLSMAYPDGTKRSTQKSNLLEVFSSTVNVPEFIDPANSAYIVDLIAQVRVSLTGAKGTFEDLFKRIFRSIPKSYRRVDIVADTYRDCSIKSMERSKHGESAKIIIGSVKSKLPSDMGKFMCNNENKTLMIQMMVDYIAANKISMLQELKTENLYFSTDHLTRHFTVASYEESIELSSDQEEADTKVILHTNHALNEISGQVILRSPSSDIDIIVLALALLDADKQQRVVYDYGTGKTRKKIMLDSYTLPENHRAALIGFHAFSGNDYVSTFFRKGKVLCWRLMIKDGKFLELFQNLGDELDVDRNLVTSIEHYVCQLYGCVKSVTSVNEARVDLFRKKHLKDNKVIDLSMLPPCLPSLEIHIKRANYIAWIWKKSLEPIISVPEFDKHGWTHLGDIQWTSGDPFPSEIEDLLLNDDDNEDDESVEEIDNESDNESDYEDSEED